METTATSSTRYKVGDTVLATMAAPGGKSVWRKGVVKSISMKWIGMTAQPITSVKGVEIIKGRTLGPLYWVAIEESRLNESPRWENELKPMEEV